MPALMGVRFLAAFYVVLFHGFPWFAARFTIPGYLQIFFKNGYLAVGLFFLLSGFILAYTYEGQISGSKSRLRFWEARFARIYPVYFLSLALAYWFEPGLSLGTRIAVLSMVQAWNPWKAELAGAWNYPAWSLSVEGFFYLLFPFFLPWLSRRSDRTLYWITGALLVLCVCWHTPVKGLGNWDRSSLLDHFLPLPLLRLPEFLLGMTIGLQHLRGKHPKPGLPRSSRISLCAFSILVLLSLPIGTWVSLVMVPFSILVHDLAVGESRLARLLSTPTMVLLGGASYSVYLLQFPVRSWTRVLSEHLLGRIAHLGTPFTPIVLVIFSIGVYRFWEEPARKALRNWFARRNQG